MPIMPRRGLRGLPGLNTVSEQERQAFMLANEDKLKQYRSPGQRKKAADILYNNQQFISTFGQETFDKMNNGTQTAYDARNAMLREKVIGDAFDKAFKPKIKNGVIDKNTGAGEEWARLSELPTDAKEELLRSEWQTPAEFKESHKDTGEWVSDAATVIDAATQLPIFLAKKIGGEKVEKFLNTLDAKHELADLAKEGIRQYQKEQNDNILNKIYNDTADKAASANPALISQAYVTPEITGQNDEDTRQKFLKEITPNSYEGNMGISEFASHYGTGSEDDLSRGDMEEFSIDDMRQILAKKYVYERTMSKQMANTALNNEAKRYIKSHQTAWERFGMFAKDVGISAMSYSADKVNGIYNAGLWAADQLGDKPVVYVDDAGNVLDPNKTKIMRSSDGTMTYQDEEGKTHFVHQEEMDRTVLHNMGKNFDGSDADAGVFHLNPLYWTRAEQFGTLDVDEQKQFEKLGSSPYKVAYNPNEESDLVYESFKMMSFGLADAASVFIPFGIGEVGKVLSTASKAGKVVNRFGKAMNVAGRYLGAQTKVGQMAQGLAGAGGIAYAYQRGAFQETLAKNLAATEELLVEESKKEVYDRYNNDAQYKKEVDTMVAAKANQMMQEYIAEAQKEGQYNLLDRKALEEMILAQASDAVHNELVEQKIQEGKASDKYAQWQQRAIDEAGDAAWNTFWPEAIKYGLVNTLGYRKFLYTNPTGLKREVSRTLKGLKEVVTDTGKKRLATDASKFSTIGGKMKQLGKVAGSQFWGGAWTNGTDDMMVDAAERMSEDSFQQYLNAYENGEGLANEYGLIDGVYSYWKGLGNSLGQRTTWNAAAVGGFGSMVSAAPNMANIASLATKEGREAYKNNFKQRYKRNEDGTLVVGEDGKPVMEELSFADNWRDRIAFLIQNGVLSDYYGKKQNERDLQMHADYVNKILDDYEDFDVIGKMITADIGADEAQTTGDKKTMRFIQAIHAMDALNHLAVNSEDPSSLSSVVANAQSLIEKAAKMGEGEVDMNEDEIKSLLGQYYSARPDISQSDENNQKALQEISRNAKKLVEATTAYDNAELQVQQIEKSAGKSFPVAVRNRMKMNQALDKHWNERRETMRDEIGDSSSLTETTADDILIASVGGRKNAESLIKVYDRQQAELEQEAKAQAEKNVKLEEALQKAKDNLKTAKNSNDRYAAEEVLRGAEAQLENGRMQEEYLRELIARSKDKQGKMVKAVSSLEEGASDIVLTADAIFGLDVITRARMMNPDNRKLYSEAQQEEITTLEGNLLMKGDDALQKVQDIALLTQRIASNKDAYSKLAQHPEAAAVQMEEQRMLEADTAVRLINFRNAQTLAEAVSSIDESLKVHGDVATEQRNTLAFRLLRKHSPVLLDLIEQEKMLPQYAKEVADAKAWSEVVSDINAVINQSEESEEWKKKTKQDVDAVIDSASNKDEIMHNLEQAIDDVDNPRAVFGYEKVLQGLEKLDYQRDATILESRKQRKEREEAEKKKREDEKKALEDAQAVAAEQQFKAQQAEEAQSQHAVSPNGDNVVSWEVAPVDEDASQTQEEDIKPEVFDWFANEQLGEIQDEVEVYSQVYKTLAPIAVIDIEDVAALNEILGDNTTDEDVKEFQEDLKKSKTGGFYDPETQKIYIFAANIARKDVEGTLFHENLHRGWQQYYGENPIAVAEAFWNTESTTHPEKTQKHKDDITKAYDGKSEAEIHEEYLTYILANAMVKGTVDKVLERLSPEHQEVVVNVLKNIGYEISEETKERAERREKQDSAVVGQSDGEVLLPSTVGGGVATLVDDGETLHVESASIDSQMLGETQKGSKEQHVSENNVDYAASNGIGEHVNETNVSTLSGNAMSMYDPLALQETGMLIHKQGEKENDSMNKFFAWMDAAGIKLQNIIDVELNQLLKKNPNLKVRFMTVRPEDNATKDGDVKTHLFLVTDYNSTIEKVHNEDNGGVIESQGKKYLITGVVGYSKNNAEKQVLYDILFSNNPKGKNGYGLMKRGTGAFWTSNPSERFYVHPTLSTEIVPSSLIPGYLVKQMENEEGTKYRSVMDLLEDGRNPLGLELDELAWGIQEREGDKFMVIGANPANVMVPRNPGANVGRAFVLVPASNGKMVPSYLRPLFYAEMNDGKLKDTVNQLLVNAVSPVYEERLKAVLELGNILYFDKTGDNILIGSKSGSHRNQVSLMHNGEVFRTFTLDADFDRREFMDAFTDMNPRVNITAPVLQSKTLLQQYNEAGALQTDISMLHTAGSSYSIFALDGQGNMLKPEARNNDDAVSTNSPEYKKDVVQVVYQNQFYVYDQVSGDYYLNGEPVVDEAKIKALDYNRRIVEGNLLPAKTENVWKYYIMGSKDNPEVIMVNKNTYEVKEVGRQGAEKLLDKVAKDKEVAAKKEAVEKKMSEEMQKMEVENVQDVDLGIDFTVDSNTGNVVAVETSSEALPQEKEKIGEKEEEKEVAAETQEKSVDKLRRSGAELETDKPQGTQDFNSLVKSKQYRKQVLSTIKTKWPDAPSKIADLVQFLKDKNVEIDAIGTSEVDVQAWIKTVEDCR